MAKKVYKQTPSQTVGPFFSYGITPEQYAFKHKSVANNYMYKNNSKEGEHISIEGSVFDGEGNSVNDAIVELRQDNTLDGFGRMGTGTEPNNKFFFHTIKPKSKDNTAPYINVLVIMRGLLNHVFTRIYFSDEALANSNDPVLNKVPKDRKHTLIAQRKDVNGKVIYTFNIHMQGENETVFFDA